MNSKVSILVVGEPGSCHTAKFVSALKDLNYEVSIFQSEHYFSEDEHLRNTKIYLSAKYKESDNSNILIADPMFKIFQKFVNNISIGKLIYRFRGKYFNEKLRAKHLVNVIKSINPSLIISLKMQNDSYTTLEAKNILKDRFPPWIYFSWGTDIEFFGKNKDYYKFHIPKIKQVLEACDFHIADCKRDEIQAPSFGFKGISLGTMIAQCGFDLSEIDKLKKKFLNSPRPYILVKGRQGGYIGKAFNSLAALIRLYFINPDLFNNKTIVVMYANESMKFAIDFIKTISNLKIILLPKISYNELLEYYFQSEITLSATDVDGSPLFLLESILSGAVPIHSRMSSVQEWIDEGKNGLLFDVDNIDEQMKKIEFALRNRNFRNDVAILNEELTSKRLDRSINLKQLKSFVELAISSK